MILILRLQILHISLFLLQLLQQIRYLLLGFLIFQEHFPVLGLNLLGEIRPVQKIGEILRLQEQGQIIHISLFVYVLNPKLHGFVLLFLFLLGRLVISLSLIHFFGLGLNIALQKLDIQHQGRQLGVQGIHLAEHAVALTLDGLHLGIDFVQLLLGRLLLLLNL